jgi:nucleoside-diphosphate-sugar epimerase
MKVLVTGGTGFLGAYIIKALIEKNHTVRAIRRSPKQPFFIPSEILSRVEWVDGDVFDVQALSDAMEGMDAVIHSAAIVSFDSRQKENMDAVNVGGTANVVNVAIEKRIRRFVHISSVAALGRTRQAAMVNETRKWEDSSNNTHYALSKHRAELEVWRGFGEGLEGVILNPSTILGFGDWKQSSCAIFKNGYKAFPWYTEGVNGFVGVEDVARAAVLLMESAENEKRFIVSAENWTFKKLFETIAAGFGKKGPRKKATPLLGAIVWRLEKIRSLFADGKPLLTRESARIAHSKTGFDNTLILSALPGFTFTPLEEVIRNSCEKYKRALRTEQISV